MVQVLQRPQTLTDASNPHDTGSESSGRVGGNWAKEQPQGRPLLWGGGGGGVRSPFLCPPTGRVPWPDRQCRGPMWPLLDGGGLCFWGPEDHAAWHGPGQSGLSGMEARWHPIRKQRPHTDVGTRVFGRGETWHLAT